MGRVVSFPCVLSWLLYQPHWVAEKRHQADRLDFELGGAPGE